MEETKYPNSIRNINLEELCLDKDKFGPLVFLKALPPLKKMQGELSELEDYDYKSNLTVQEQNQIDSAQTQVLGYINQIKNFTLENNSNPQVQRDNIEQSIESFYNSTFATYTRTPLIYLRQIFSSNSKTEKEFRNSLIESQKVVNELKKDLSAIRETKKQIDDETKKVEAGQGIVGAAYLSKAFRRQVAENEEEISAQKKFLWFFNNNLQSKVRYSFTLLFALTVGLFLIYFYLIKDVAGSKVEFGVFSSVLIASAFYYVRLVVREYNIKNHLKESNTHRANVAETLESFLKASGSDVETKNALLKEGSTAMFQSDASGYLNKDQMEVSTPVKELITTFVKDSK